MRGIELCTGKVNYKLRGRYRKETSAAIVNKTLTYPKLGPVNFSKLKDSLKIDLTSETI